MNKNAVIKRAGLLAGRKLSKGEMFSIHKLCKEYGYPTVYVALHEIKINSGQFYYQLKTYLFDHAKIEQGDNILNVISKKSKLSTFDTMENNKSST